MCIVDMSNVSNVHTSSQPSPTIGISIPDVLPGGAQGHRGPETVIAGNIKHRGEAMPKARWLG